MKIQRNIPVEITLTAAEIAQVFLDMQALQQAEVFNAMAKIVSTASIEAAEHSKEERKFMPWSEGIKSFEAQMNFMDSHLNNGARLLLRCFKKVSTIKC